MLCSLLAQVKPAALAPTAVSHLHLFALQTAASPTALAPLPSLPLQAMGLRDFLLGALCFDPAKRSTAGELLEHPWLRGELPRRPARPPAQQWAAGPQAEAARPSSVGRGSTDEGQDS